MKKFYSITVFLLTVQYFASAQALVYRPRNPSFGGDTFNYNWMLSSAQIQDKTTDPKAKITSSTSSSTNLNDFTETLNRQLLSSLSRQLYTSQFGEDGLKEGTYQYGDFTVDVSPGAEGLIVRIGDGKGGETSITVPYY
jgi:curli production assembly/transport component CsgF